MKAFKAELSAALVLAAVVVLGRLAPHPTNFQPVAAVALFAGFFFRRTSVAVAVPVLGLAAADAVLGVYDVRVMAAVYLCLAFPLALRGIWRSGVTAGKVVAAAVGSSLVFFGVVDLAVWGFSGLYPQTAAGLWECYVAALPFLRNQILGDLFWSGLLFGAHALLTQLAHRRAAAAS